RSVRLFALPVLLAVAWLALPLPARADSLDQVLLQKSGKILHHLHRLGYRNVGVLPFIVKKGIRPAGFAQGPISANLPARLENALILAQDPEGKQIGIIRDAAGQAREAGIGSFREDGKELDRLFALDYQLAWGTKKVKADAFVTGQVIHD